MRAAVIHFNIINNRLQASLPHCRAVSCISLTATFPLISPAVELPKNLIPYAEKVSSLCWATGSEGEKKKKKKTCYAFLSRSREVGEGEEGGQSDFEHIRCAAEPVTAARGRTENSAPHFWKLAVPVLLGDYNQRWQDSVMKGEFRSTIKAAVRGPKNRELKVGAVFFFSML